MTKAVIYQTSRNVMQSNMFSRQGYILHIVSKNDFPTSDKLMGWSSSSNTENQIKLSFNTLLEATNFASSRAYDYYIIPNNKVIKDKKSYSFNIIKNRNLYYY